MLDQDKWIVYLMHKHDRGWRIGVTRSVRVGQDRRGVVGREEAGAGVPVDQRGGGDRLWLVEPAAGLLSLLGREGGYGHVAGELAAGAPAHVPPFRLVEMQMIAMGFIVIGRKHRREQIAGAIANVAQEK